MAEELPQLAHHDPCAKARQILAGMSHYRIDPSIIQDSPVFGVVQGDRGTIVVAKFSLLETRMAPTLFPGARTAPFLEVELAVKKLEWNRNDAKESTRFFKSLVNELSILATLSHPNIIHLIGFVEDMEEGKAWIIVPWEVHGDVREFLRAGMYDIPERVSLIQDVASGLEYLHTRQPPICHGDLKSRNILVNSSYRAVITDFGTARIKESIATLEQENQLASPHQIPVNSKDFNEAAGLKPEKIDFDATTLALTLTGPKYSIRWAAPEIMGGEGQNFPSDIWALGWVCWEIATDMFPYGDISTATGIIHAVIQGELPPIRENTSLSRVLQLCSLMSDCWFPEPAERIDVSTFCRKVRFVPSSTPSNDIIDGEKVRPVALLLELGRMYSLQNNTAQAESYYLSAFNAATQTKDDTAKADALIGLGEVHNARSRYLKAEEAFGEARDIHFRVSNDLGATNALMGMGESYNALSRYQEAEKAFTTSHEIYSHIGNELGAANSLVGLGESYSAQSRYQEAENAFLEAFKTHSRIGNKFGVANALIGLGEVYTALLKHEEAKNAFREAQGIYADIGGRVGLARAAILLCEAYNALLDYPEADAAFEHASLILTGLENEISPQNTPNHPEEDCDTQSIYSGDEEVEEDHRGTKHNTAKEANAPEEDSALIPMRQEQDLSEQLTAIAHASVPATKELIDLLQALGKAAPKAVRNKHKIYSILRGSRDICNHIMEIGDPRERQSHPDIKAILTRTEDYFALLDALEENLLQLAAILPTDIEAFGADSYSSWHHSRSTLAEILDNLSHPPFSTISSHVQDIPDDLFLDDCSWLSRLLYREIHPEISTQFLDAPKTHPVFVVTKGLEYLETQVKCGVPDEPTRELIIDIATLLAQTLASTSQDDADKSLQDNDSLATEADRDWLAQELAGSFSILDLDSALQPSTAKELTAKWTDIRIGFASRGPSVPEN